MKSVGLRKAKSLLEATQPRCWLLQLLQIPNVPHPSNSSHWGAKSSQGSIVSNSLLNIPSIASKSVPLIFQILGFWFFLKIFFDVDHFKSLYWICYHIVSVLCFGCLIERHVGSYLAPWPGIEPEPPAQEGGSLNHWTTREVSVLLLNKIPYCVFREVVLPFFLFLDPTPHYLYLCFVGDFWKSWNIFVKFSLELKHNGRQDMKAT